MDDTYPLKIEGSVALGQFELRVNAEECTGAQFAGSTVAQENGAPVNVVTFRELPPGQTPKGRLQFLAGTPPGSDNVKPDWTGQLACGGGTVAVTAFRLHG